MPRFLSLPVETLWRLRRLAVLLALLPWLVWLPPVLFAGADPTPQGIEGWLLFGWLALVPVLLVLFPAAHWDHLALAVVLAGSALILPVLTALLEPFRPLTDRQMVGVLGGAALFGLLMLLAWTFLWFALHQLSLVPPRLRLRSRAIQRSTLSPGAVFRGLRHAPLQANHLRMTGAPDDDGWFPVWHRYAWEDRIGDVLAPDCRSEFIGPRTPDYWARIRSETSSEQIMDERSHDPDERKDIAFYRLQTLPDGDGARVIEDERGFRMPLLMGLGYWLCDGGASSLRARLDYLEGQPRTRAAYIRTRSPIKLIANLMDPLSAGR